MNDDTRRSQRSSTRHRDRLDETACRELAAQVMAGWRNGEPIDARAALSRHHDLGQYKSVALDLAYEEYCLRTEQGESISASQFCERFPDYKKSLHHQIEIHRLLDSCPQLVPRFTPEHWPEAGEQVLGYTIVEELGRGTFARVYLATEEALGRRQVAIKVALHGEDEADTLGMLQHANIVPVFSVQRDQTDGLTVICMPYLGRATLNDVLDAAYRSPIKPRRARAVLEAATAVNVNQAPWGHAERLWRGCYVDAVLKIGVKLAEALAYAHDKGILHLDIKPSNVLVTNGGAPMLLDFNLSVDRRKGGTRVGGTLPYMPPEQLRCFSGDEAVKPLDGRADVFSLGVILYELLCGQLPYGDVPESGSSQQIARELVVRREGGPRSLRFWNPDVSDRITRIIERCLAFDPARRYASAGELAAALRRELRLPQRARRWAAMHPKLVWRSALAAALLLAVMAVLLILRDPYALRQYKLGVAAFDQGAYAQALEHFDNSVGANPARPAAYFYRARTHAEQNEFLEAVRDLNDYLDRAPSANPRAMVLLAYCCNRLRNHHNAADWYRQAVLAGFDEAFVHYNLGVTYQLQSKELSARWSFDAAIDRDGRLVEALHARAVMSLLDAQHDGGYHAAAEPHARAAMADIQRALDGNRPSMKLYRDAARIYHLASHFDRRWKSRARDYLRLAVQSGASLDALERIPQFGAFVKAQRDELLKLPPLTGPLPEGHPTLIDPRPR